MIEFSSQTNAQLPSVLLLKLRPPDLCQSNNSNYDTLITLGNKQIRTIYFNTIVPTCTVSMTFSTWMFVRSNKMPPTAMKERAGKSKRESAVGRKKRKSFYHPCWLIEYNGFSVPFFPFTFTWKRHKQCSGSIEESEREKNENKCSFFLWVKLVIFYMHFW